MVIEEQGVSTTNADTALMPSFHDILTSGHSMDSEPHIDNSTSSVSCDVVCDHGG